MYEFMKEEEKFSNENLVKIMKELRVALGDQLKIGDTNNGWGL